MEQNNNRTKVPSLYARYVQEREGALAIEKDWGFVTYKIESDHVFICDFFIALEERKSGKGIELLNMVISIARKEYKNVVATSVVPSTKNVNQMIQILTHLDFNIVSSGNDIVYLAREI